MNRFIFIDKPKGITSFYLVKILRKRFGVKRIGFIGTLDPVATGLMIFALGEATKLIHYLEGLDKVYEVEIVLGGVSNTYDCEGKISHKFSLEELQEKFGNPRGGLKKSDIQDILDEKFLGEVEQIPPIFSAIKIDGKRAYESARENEKIEMKSRKVSFFETTVKSLSLPYVRLKTHVSSGTYIRSLAHDLGATLGIGGYVNQLRRTKINGFSVTKACTVEDLDTLNAEKYLLKCEEVFTYFEQKNLTDVEYKKLGVGGFLDANKNTAEKMLAMYNGECVGVIERIFQNDEFYLKFAKKFNA